MPGMNKSFSLCREAPGAFWGTPSTINHAIDNSAIAFNAAGIEAQCQPEVKD